MAEQSIGQVIAERDAALAVIEQAKNLLAAAKLDPKSWLTSPHDSTWNYAMDYAMELLSRAPTPSAPDLASIQADAWDAGVLAGNTPFVEKNPYRNEAA